jgi:hypothetical protein
VRTRTSNSHAQISRTLRMKNTNFLQDSSFQLVLPRFQNVQFHGQGVSIPGITLNAARAATPYVDMPLAGDKMVFSPLQTTFIIDENLSNYEEIFNWMQSISFATSNEDFTNYRERGPAKIQSLGEQDITLTILNSKNNPVVDFIFHDAIPVGLSGPTLMTTSNDLSYLTCTATFEYTYFKMVRNSA